MVAELLEAVGGNEESIPPTEDSFRLSRTGDNLRMILLFKICQTTACLDIY